MCCTGPEDNPGAVLMVELAAVQDQALSAGAWGAQSEGWGQALEGVQHMSQGLLPTGIIEEL